MVQSNGTERILTSGHYFQAVNGDPFEFDVKDDSGVKVAGVGEKEGSKVPVANEGGACAVAENLKATEDSKTEEKDLEADEASDKGNMSGGGAGAENEAIREPVRRMLQRLMLIMKRAGRGQVMTATSSTRRRRQKRTSRRLSSRRSWLRCATKFCVSMLSRPAVTWASSSHWYAHCVRTFLLTIPAMLCEHACCICCITYSTNR
eukprot:6172612-Pleurochrysis_carterae.AAC.2